MFNLIPCGFLLKPTRKLLPRLLLSQESSGGDRFWEGGKVGSGKQILSKCLVISLFCIFMGCSKLENYLHKGDEFLENGDYEKAAVEYQKALEKNPSFANAHLYKKVEASPEDESVYLTLGIIYEKKKKYKAASTNYSDALKINPKNEIALFKLAKILELEGHYSDAVKKYRDVPKQSSLFAKAQERISEIQEMQGYKSSLGTLGSGYKNAKWGMSPTQVKNVLKGEIIASGDNYIEYNIGAGKTLKCWFHKNQFYCAYYRPKLKDDDELGAKAVLRALTEKYGTGRILKGDVDYFGLPKLTIIWDDGITEIKYRMYDPDPSKYPREWRHLYRSSSDLSVTYTNKKIRDNINREEKAEKERRKEERLRQKMKAVEEDL